MKVKSSVPLSISAVREMLKAREKEGELGYEQKQAQEYVEKFAKGTRKESEKTVEKIMANGKITAEVAVTLANVAPRQAETVKAIALKDKIELTDEEANEIIKLF